MKPPKVRLKEESDQKIYEIIDSKKIEESLKRTFGSNDPDFIKVLVKQVLTNIQTDSQKNIDTNGYLAALFGFAPNDELEGLLSVQMIAVHNMAMEFIRRSTLEDQTSEGIDKNVSRVSKLLRLFNAQIEALTRYRNKGQQQIAVQHIQVNGGKTAIVGNVPPKCTRGVGTGKQ